MDRDFPLPPKVYCNYCKVEDRIIEDFPWLIVKWKAKGPQNNNLFNISTEDKEEKPTIAIITRSGINTNEDVATPGNMPVVEARKARGPNPSFDPQKEKDTFMEARQEFTTNDAEEFTYKGCSDPR